MSGPTVDLVFGALADPTRRSILEIVASAGPVTATGLARRLPISRQAAAKHLRSLAAAGMVTSARRGREVRYGLGGRGLETGMGWMSEVGRDWDERLAALREHVRQ